MRSHGFADDGEAQACSLLLFARPAPEPFENVLAILRRNPPAAISHINPASAINGHSYLASGRRMNDCILNQISESIFKRVSVSFHFHWLLGSDKRNCSLLRDGPGRHHGHNRGGDLVDINGVEFERNGVQASDAKQLLNQPVHTCDVGLQFPELAISVHRFERRCNDRERGPKFMGGIGGKLALYSKALLEAIERAVYGN